MSVYFQLRPRLPLPRPQPTFSRGIRLARRSSGDEALKWLHGPGAKYKDAFPRSQSSNWLGGDYVCFPRALHIILNLTSSFSHSQ